MCQFKINPASTVQLDQLRDPAALAAIEVLKQTGWFAADAQSLDKFFQADPGHPAKLALEDEARNGGQFALFQFAVLFGFGALAVLISAHQKTLSPMIFVLWGVLGVSVGLLVAKYPGRLFGKRKARV